MNPAPERSGRIRRRLLAMAAAGAGALGVAALILTRPFVEPSGWESPPHPGSIYRDVGSDDEVGGSHAAAPWSRPVVSPFHLDTDPMDRLLLVNFEGDPDRIYLGFEPQAFNDTSHGRGLLVLGWRVDGRVDVFHEPGLRLDPETFGIAGKGLHKMEERSFAEARFELGPAGARVDLGFRDLEGRKVRLLIRETDTRPRRPFGLLAPMGSAASNPPALPLVYVHDFYFVRRAGSEVRIEIDGRPHRGDPIPLLLDGAWVHFLRYSPDPFIVTWNPASEGSIAPLEPHPDTAPGRFQAESRGVLYDLSANGAFREIRRMSRREGAHEVAVEFDPPFPHLLALRDGVEVSGRFRISADPTVGTVTGRWRVTRQGRELRLEAIPSGGWTPGEVPRVVRLLFRAVPVFRTWPTTYLWRGTLTLPGEDAERNGQEWEAALTFQSAWERME